MFVLLLVSADRFIEGSAATARHLGVSPLLIGVIDPVNRSFMGIWELSWFYSNDFIIRLEQRFMSTLGQSQPANDPWFAAGRFHRRDETLLRLTYQF